MIGAPAQLPLVHWSPVVQPSLSLQGVPLALVDVCMQPLIGSMVLLSGSATQVPVEHCPLQTALLGVLVHSSVLGSQVSVVHVKPSLQMLALMQPEPQSQMSSVHGSPSSRSTGVTTQ